MGLEVQEACLVDQVALETAVKKNHLGVLEEVAFLEDLVGLPYLEEEEA